MVVAPVVLGVLYIVFARTRFGRLVRAATEDREMLGALGVNQSVLFTTVFALGALLAGLGGALQLAREPANLGMDLTVITDAFVVVVIGGMGSIVGSYVAAVLIAEVKALCIGVGLVSLGGFSVNFSKLTLVAEFLVMAVVLIARPQGLLGRPQVAVRGAGALEAPIRPASRLLIVFSAVVLLALVSLPVLARSSPYALVLGVDVLIAVLFATSLHFIMGPGGMHSFGHAAYFGLGAYGAALAVKWLAAPMGLALAAAPVAAALGALLFGWFAVRLSGVYLAMLTLAFAQIVWSIVFQWQELTGGSNGILGIWPSVAIRRASGVLSSHALLRRWRRTAAAARLVRAVRLRDARRPGLAAACGGDRDRREAGALARLRARRDGLRRRRRHFRLRQGLDLPGDDQHRAIHRRSGHGAARRHPDARRSDCRRFGLCDPARLRHAADRILARASGWHHSCAGAGLSVRPRRCVRATRTTACRMTELAVTSLHKNFGAVRAVDNVTFTVGDGEFLALIGPNGAGKSTCFNLINGQLPPDSGAVRFDGRDIAGLPPREICRRGIARTFQIAATFGSMTVAENVQMALIAHAGATYKLWRPAASYHRARALELLAQVGMRDAADRPCSELAYGDVKRVELAIALASEPRLLLMDEPTAGMAPRERNALIALVKTLVVERGVSVLFTEHSMDVVFAFADRIVVMARGRLIADGDAQDDPRRSDGAAGLFRQRPNHRTRGQRRMTSPPALAVEYLNAWYGAAQILYDVAFTVGRGEVVALMGRNGAGKSTTMKAVMGLMPRRSGTVAVNGRDVSMLRPFEIARLGLGFVPEDRRIFSELTVAENLDAGRQPQRRLRRRHAGAGLDA